MDSTSVDIYIRRWRDNGATRYLWRATIVHAAYSTTGIDYDAWGAVARALTAMSASKIKLAYRQGKAGMRSWRQSKKPNRSMGGANSESPVTKTRQTELELEHHVETEGTRGRDPTAEVRAGGGGEGIEYRQRAGHARRNGR